MFAVSYVLITTKTIEAALCRLCEESRESVIPIEIAVQYYTAPIV